MLWCEHANTRNVNEHSWLSDWVISSILAYLAHLAQSLLSLIFSVISTYNFSWFDLTNKKIWLDRRQRLGEKWPMLTTFFLTATAAITGTFCSSLLKDESNNVESLNRNRSMKNVIQLRRSSQDECHVGILS